MQHYGNACLLSADTENHITQKIPHYIAQRATATLVLAMGTLKMELEQSKNKLNLIKRYILSKLQKVLFLRP